MHLELEQPHQAIGAFFPETFRHPQTTSILASVFGLFPRCGDTFGFEVRLGSGNASVDIGLGFNTSSPAHAYLALPGKESSLGTAAIDDERWHRIVDFGRRWSKADSSFSTRVPFIFLEFDSDRPHFPAPVPSIFLGLDWPVEELGTSARSRGREGDWGSTPGFDDTIEMVRTLRRDPLEAEVQNLLARCFATVPDGGLVLHLAVMLGRPGEGVRVSVMVPRCDARTYLYALGWREGLGTLDRTLEMLAPYTDFEQSNATIQVDLDVGATLGPAIGVMLRPPDDHAWPQLLDALVQRGLCAPDKRDALLAWPGASIALLDSDGQPQPCALVRDIAHAKITCGAGIEPKAKAYFGVTPRWLSA